MSKAYIAIGMAIVGQLMLKWGLRRHGEMEFTLKQFWPNVFGIIKSPLIFGGLIVFGLSSYVWIVALSKLDISKIYPMVSISYVVLFIFAWLFWKEPMSLLRVGGMILICLGVVLISRS